jgi:ABC-2 type transport system permease protein
MIVTGAMSFWFIRSSAISNMVLNSLRGFVNYPVTIYNRFVRILLTYFIPYAFVNINQAKHYLVPFYNMQHQSLESCCF